jgi:hypothetical protein
MRKHISQAKAFVLSRLRRADDVLAQMVSGFPAPGAAASRQRMKNE